jgi:hypothetical protein
MAFKNLESRFNENVNKLYSAGTLKFENGKPSNGRNDDPLIVRKPGNGYWGFGESRSLPVRSALIDVKRLTLFTLSKRGLLFLAKQQLLQTGNTFEHTRIINPVFAVGNAVPFLHIRRNLRPLAIGGTVGKVLSLIGITKNATPKSPADLRKIGQLQQETYDKWNGGSGLVKSLIKKIPVIGQTISAFSAKRSMGEVGNGWTYSRPELGKNNSEYFVYRYNVDTAPDAGILKLVKNAIKFLFKVDIGGEDGVGYGAIKANGKYVTYLNYSNDKSTWERSIQTDYNAYRIRRFTGAVPPKISDVAEKSTLKEEEYKSSDLQKHVDTQIKNYVATAQTRSEAEQALTRPQVGSGILPVSATGKAFVRYFSAGNVGLSTATEEGILSGNSTNMQDKVAGYRTSTAFSTSKTKKKISYIQDDANLPIKSSTDKNSKPAYRSINSNFDDPIVVSFAMGQDDPVRFRAFIKDLNQSATPEYKSYQYIGRMEKFVNYVGVQRDISFKLGVIAFSKDELDGVWARINYLTGLVFPYGFNRGIFQPNIVRLTIGDVYTEQPGYVTSLSTNFNELGESWEIDAGRQVPIAAQMDIKFTIIEKTSKVADSPFYGITETIFEVPYLSNEKAPAIIANTQVVENRKPPVISSANIKLPTSGR